MKRGVLLVILLITSYLGHAQFLMDMIDTTKDMGSGLLGVYKNFNHLRITGYMQPQYQFATDTGINSYAGGNFDARVNNRFMFRRGRVRFDYVRFTKDDYPSLQFVFQFDGTERGVNIRDFWGRIWENRWHNFYLTTGMFARPFGYEINISSGDRETPERGRMSQILMKTERDLGAMVSFEPSKRESRFKKLKIDAGIFNGQGLAAPAELDRYKDFIAQLYWKPTKIAQNLSLSGGISYLNGGIIQPGKYRYSTVKNGDGAKMVADSSHRDGSRAPRKYMGANMQLKLKHGWGATEWRAEYWQGTQPGTQAESTTPTLIRNNESFYFRKFNGAFLYILQNLVNADNQLLLKYDWYDANTEVSGKQIGAPGSNFSQADLSYRTFGFGYLRHFTQNLKLVLYYDLVRNEATNLAPFTNDIKDDVFTARLQFRF